MKLLIGTTNPAKAGVFAQQLSGYDVELLTLTDRAWGQALDAKEKTVILSYEKKLSEFYVQALGLK